MYWFLSDVVISSRKKIEEKKEKSISMAVVTYCYCHCFSPPLFQKLAVIFNPWVINYWGAAGWQDARHDELTEARMLNM